MQIIVLNNQSLLDIAVRYCGTVEAVTDIAILNNISITEELISGQLIQIPSKDYGFQEVVNYFVANKVEPATALTEDLTALIEANSGIGYWIIGTDFKVE